MSQAPAALAIYLFGPLRIERRGQPVDIDTRKAIALLAYLALQPARRSRDQLAALFWPAYDQGRAYANLRRTLWALNKAVGEGWLAADNLALALRQQPGLWVDVAEFQRLLATCHTHPHGRDEVCPACLEPLAQAVPLVRGEFLEGFSLRDSALFVDWRSLEAETLHTPGHSVAAPLSRHLYAGCHHPPGATDRRSLCRCLDGRAKHDRHSGHCAGESCWVCIAIKEVYQ